MSRVCAFVARGEEPCEDGRCFLANALHGKPCPDPAERQTIVMTGEEYDRLARYKEDAEHYRGVLERIAKWPYHISANMAREALSSRCGAFDTSSGEQCVKVSDHDGPHVLSPFHPPLPHQERGPEPTR